MDDAAILPGLAAALREAAAMARAAAPRRAAAKAPQDYVTEVDLAVDALLAERLAALTPGVAVLSEERAVETTGRLARYWIVDPIDGTLNLMAGLPFVGVSAALVDAGGPRVAGVVRVSDGLICAAVRDGGATCGGAPLRTPPAPAELVALSTGLLDALIAEHAGAYAAARRVGKLRNLGAQALHLCAVATGGLAAAASLEARVWDEAAGGLIAREAGCLWRARSDELDWGDPAGVMTAGPQRSLAAHPAVAAALSAALAPALEHGPERRRP
ncbi:inositol monophosphatase family protein [Rubrimonas cliftonensis]|uniref:Myo-inositol-1(Or 4)-monophosphatase n=1 Tax=Rubrimonas cliftonensis TaxID=89524 RepID=A0A1H4CXS5_9RHOB|nr:inositol monophosphatase family protein [Rubrimonas cliftonensis]SEA65181.1 myo-inositol-1(or 4)-monophosphatase [Rubrimonas cliftonensis]